MRLTIEQKKEWIKLLRRDLKTKNYNLTAANGEIKLLPYPERKDFTVIVDTKFYEILPTVELKFEKKIKNEYFTPEVVETIQIFVTSIKKLFLQHEEKNFLIKLKFSNYLGSKRGIIPHLEAVGLSPLDENYSNIFMNVEAVNHLKLLNKAMVEINKKYKEQYFNQAISHYDSSTNYPFSLSVVIQDVIDRKIEIEVDYQKHSFVLNFSSVHHRKKVEVSRISLEIFDMEYEQFIKEERLKELFKEPVMNEVIRRRIHTVINNLYDRTIKDEDLFKYMLNFYDLTEMTQLSVDPNCSVKELKTGKYYEHFDKERASKELKTSLFSLWGKVLVVFQEDIRVEYGTNERNFTFAYVDTFEDALIEERKWYGEKIQEGIDFQKNDDILVM